MGRRGHSTAIGKFAKVHHDRRVSEIRMLGESLRNEKQWDPQVEAAAYAAVALDERAS